MALAKCNQQDAKFMAEAIQLAWRGLYTTDPNPRVGCVLVKGGDVVGRGWHVRAGEGHAEVNALIDAGEKAKGATAYVTLEPCSHYGRTPPCAEALINAGVSRVVAAMEDPNPQVAGKGLAMLRDAGIDISVGLLGDEARKLNPGFIKRMCEGLPFVRIKTAISVDGRTAMASGESHWITGSSARSDVQRLRARSSAIVSGIDTVLDDDAALTVRAGELGLPEAADIVAKQPLRVILDSKARLTSHAKLLQQEGSVLWVVSELAQPDADIEALPDVTVFRLSQDDVETRNLKSLLTALAEMGCNEVLVEAGATLAGSFIQQAYWDELLVYMAPKLMGSQGRPLANLPVEHMAESVDMTLDDLRMVGDDVRFTFTPKTTASNRA